MSDQPEKTYPCRILAIEPVTHDVHRYVLEKPSGYHFQPGQATEISLDFGPLQNEKRPFTFTSLNADANLEFTIKSYPAHHSVTEKLPTLQPGQHLTIRDPWGAITFRGPGTFIAGGAGVTPFIAILRQLEANASAPTSADHDHDDALAQSVLLFSNKTAADIILQGEFTRMLGPRAVYTLTRSNDDRYLHGRINEKLIQQHNAGLTRPFYLCGPPSFVDDLSQTLENLGVQSDHLVIEE